MLLTVTVYAVDPGIDPLLGTKVHRVESLKHSSAPEVRSRESSTISKDSSAYSEAVYVGQFLFYAVIIFVVFLSFSLDLFFQFLVLHLLMYPL